MGGMSFARTHARTLILAFLAVFPACSDSGSTETRGTTRAVEQQPVDPLPSEPRWSDVVAGEERLVAPGGAVVASRKFEGSAAEKLAAEVELNAHPQSPTTRLIPVTGVAFRDGVLHSYKYLVRAAVSEGTGYPVKAGGDSAAPEKPASVLGTSLEAKLNAAKAADSLTVLITLREEPTTSLATPSSVQDAVSFQDPQVFDRQSLINARSAEVRALHAPFRQRMAQAGVAGSRLHSLWLTGALAASLTPAEIAKASADPAVRAVVLDEPIPPALANTWDGTNVYNGGTDGLNAQHYWNAGYLGDGYNAGKGRYLRLGLIGDGFYFNHSVFKTGPGGSSRFVKNWDCRTLPCTVITTPLGIGTHETEVSSAAGGSALENQVPGVTAYADQLDRTGVARRVRMYSAEGMTIAAWTAAVEKMIQEGVDVVNFARRDSTLLTCDYDVEVDQLSLMVKQAHDAGVLVVVNGGNDANPQGGCSITRLAQSTSAFTVGGTLNPPDNGYATVNRNANYSIGPMDARVYDPSSGNYTNHTGVLTAIDAMVPGFWRFGATTPDNFLAKGGTSLAAPQVAGAAMLVKHAYLANGVSYINSPGVLFTALLSMTDRAHGAGSLYKTSGFDPAWGGGRLQTRYFAGGADHPAGGAWGFDLWEVTIYNGNQIDFPIRGTGAEPASLQQFKVYAMVFEQSWKTVSDVDLYVRDMNCGSGSSQLGADASRDTKSMVRLGNSAAGQALCVRLHGYAVPPGGRRVVLASYFSVDTQMR